MPNRARAAGLVMTLALGAACSGGGEEPTVDPTLGTAGTVVATTVPATTTTVDYSKVGAARTVGTGFIDGPARTKARCTGSR